MMTLDVAKFVDDKMASGGVTMVIVGWHSPTPTVLHLVTDPDEFRIVPDSFALPAAPNGANDQRVVRITRKGTAQHCDVHFVLGDGIDDAIDSIEVT